jgi:hypothetical protein
MLAISKKVLNSMKTLQPNHRIIKIGHLDHNMADRDASLSTAALLSDAVPTGPLHLAQSDSAFVCVSTVDIGWPFSAGMKTTPFVCFFKIKATTLYPDGIRFHDP